MTHICFSFPNCILPLNSFSLGYISSELNTDAPINSGLHFFICFLSCLSIFSEDCFILFNRWGSGMPLEVSGLSIGVHAHWIWMSVFIIVWWPSNFNLNDLLTCCVSFFRLKFTIGHTPLSLGTRHMKEKPSFHWWSISSASPCVYIIRFVSMQFLN